MSQDALIQARRNPLLIKIFYGYALLLLKKQFYAVRVKNREAFLYRNPTQPTLCVGNHSNWWDGLTDFLLCTRETPGDRFYLMIEQLHRFPFLSYLGGFSIDKSSSLSAMRSLDYACQLLSRDPKTLLWIYPQGEVRPQDRRPLNFANGVGYLVKKMPHSNVIPVAHYYTYQKEDRPEVFMNVGNPLVVPPGVAKNRQALSELLEDAVTGLLEEIRADLARGEVSQYSLLLQGDLNPFKLLEADLRRAGATVDFLLHPQRLLEVIRDPKPGPPPGKEDGKLAGG